jgi:hypothetical protein
MKFAHEYKLALEREGFPTHWVDSAIKYGQLKKCIKKVEKELRSLGLDPETLGQLVLPSSARDTQKENLSRDSGDVPVSFQYDFAGAYLILL